MSGKVGYLQQARRQATDGATEKLDWIAQGVGSWFLRMSHTVTPDTSMYGWLGRVVAASKLDGSEGWLSIFANVAL